MSDIALRGVCKSYGDVTVINGVDLEIAAGEFVVLVGPSGCGKSTLLRMIAGLEEITDGDLSIAGVRMNDVPPKDRNIAMVFQSYALYPHMNVADNMGFSLRLRRVPAVEKAERVENAARILGLENLLDRFPRELSGGQRQRVAMGRAIVRDPQAFLFDEPLSNLDAKLRANTRAEIKSLHKRLKTTTVYVTHDQIEAMTMGDRIVVMHGGIVEQVGSPLELYDRPINLFVASFLGSPAMNFIDGSYDPQSGTFQIEGGPSVTIPGHGWDHAGPAILGVRPENIVPDSGGIQAVVEMAEPTGAEIHLKISLGKQSIVAAFRERAALEAGSRVSIGFMNDRVHLFDPVTTMRLAPRALDAERSPAAPRPAVSPIDA